MSKILSLQPVGNQIKVILDDGTSVLCYPTSGGLWIARANTGTGPVDPPVDPDPGTGGIYNPWASLSLTGTWEDHGSYSSGGDDYGLSYGSDIPAPASGTLHTSGGSGEFACGNIGSAGRRSILHLDQHFTRHTPASSYPTEQEGPMVAIVFQHQSEMGSDNTHYNKGVVCGKSGASANGSDYGGDTHLHIHGLTAGGSRVDFIKFA